MGILCLGFIAMAFGMEDVYLDLGAAMPACTTRRKEMYGIA